MAKTGTTLGEKGKTWEKSWKKSTEEEIKRKEGEDVTWVGVGGGGARRDLSST